MKHEPLPIPSGVNPIAGGATSAAASTPLPLLEPDAAAAFCEEGALTLPGGVRISSVHGDASQPSAHILEEIRTIRQHQVAKGHTPESDAGHTDWHFRDAVSTFLMRARLAKRPDTRRKNQLYAIGVLVAQIDAEDFQRSQEQQQGEDREHDA